MAFEKPASNGANSTTEIDVQRVRIETPACQGQAYLDNAGSALPPEIVTHTMIDYLHREAQVGGYVAQFQAEEALAAVPVSISQLIGAQPEQVALASSATAAWMRAFGSIPLERGDRLLTTTAEYASNVLPMLQAIRRVGVAVEFIPNGPDGSVDPAALGEMLDDKVKVVAITHAPSQNGLLADATGVGAVLRAARSEAWFLLDACQSVGQVPIDMTTIGCDVLTATGRKFLRGPRGTGFLALSQRALAELEPVPLDMNGTTWTGGNDYVSSPDAMRFQSFETSYAGVLGLGAAIDYALDLSVSAIAERIGRLATDLRAKLADIAGVRVLDRGTAKTGIVVFTCPGTDALARAWEFQRQGVTVTPVSAGTNPGDYATYTSAGSTTSASNESTATPYCVLRASPHVYNTEADLARLVALVADAATD